MTREPAPRALVRPGVTGKVTTMKTLHDDQSGAALVEFALVLSLLTMIVFGTIEFGRAYNAQVTLTHASREGVRILAITRDPGAAITATRDAAPSLDSTALNVSPAACNPGQPTSITVSYPFDYDIPFVGTATLTLTSTAVMRCGG